jgi:hypothetical protein
MACLARRRKLVWVGHCCPTSCGRYFQVRTGVSQPHRQTRRLLPWEQAMVWPLFEPSICRGRSETAPAILQRAPTTLGLLNRMSFRDRSPRSGSRPHVRRLSWRRGSSFACQRRQLARDASRRHPARGRAKTWNPKSGRFRPSYSAGLRTASQRQFPAGTHGKMGGSRQARVQPQQAAIE